MITGIKRRNEEKEKFEMTENEIKGPIYMKENVEENFTPICMDDFEKRETILQLRANIRKAEQERIEGASLSIAEARKQLRERMKNV